MNILMLLIMMLGFEAVADAQDAFRYPVVRDKTFKDEPGQLEIDSAGIHYKSTDGKTAIEIPFEDVYQANVADPAAVHIETYDVLKRRLGERRLYTFRLKEATHDETLAKFLTQKLKRPVLGSYGVGVAEFSIPAYHKHRLGGCNGVLEIGPNGIRFLSGREPDSRTWRYEDIETIGSSDPFHFRVNTFAETYTFDLKERLPEKAYQAAWQRVYDLPPRYSTKGEREPFGGGHAN